MQCTNSKHVENKSVFATMDCELDVKSCPQIVIN